MAKQKAYKVKKTEDEHDKKEKDFEILIDKIHPLEELAMISKTETVHLQKLVTKVKFNCEFPHSDQEDENLV